MPTPMPKDGEVEADEEEAEMKVGQEEKAPTDKDVLGDKA